MRRRLGRLAALMCCLALAACTGGQVRHGVGGPNTVSFALPPSAAPNWILPLPIPGYTASYNGVIQSALFLPLYAYDGSSGAVALDDKASAADAPVYAPDGKSVTITLKPLSWSDGTPLTSADVQFWFDMVRAAKDEWAVYSKGLMPDDVTDFHVVDDHTFTLTLDKTYNPGWFTANQLALMAPLPKHAWSHDTDPRKNFDYLVSQAKNLGGYNSSPLWKVVDGPFELQSFSPTGQVTLAKNPHYTGEDAAHLDKVTFLTFTSSAAEYNVLLAGGVDYGYVPTTNLGQKPKLESLGYRIEPWNGWSITYIPYNFNNPALGNVFKQLYIRQAIQHTVDQQAISQVIWRGTATPGHGPVPQDNDPTFLSESQKNDPYPFDLDAAKKLLGDHGWQPGADGVRTCQEPKKCGQGIDKGTRLSMTLLTESGSDETDGTMQELKSELSKVGIELRINAQPLNTVLANGSTCEPSSPACAWQLSYFGTQGSWYFPAYPSGEQLFATDAGVNFGNYRDKPTDDLIAASTLSTSPQAMVDYSARLAEQLPVIWMPNPPYQVSAIDTSLGGITQDPLAGLQPQRWYRR
ncbi:peptide ABC transporter substrate-binding protein [Kutzneria chonburiensis]|uniref:ABC transporter substrate-binding protein n=1 Tax=Kutzneria chonburiensis TaxID=1483604 RepID=A0ABV6MTD0_9PSEU|nr:peptide ABC transporter substrate-binding protein [Kutzneria chonburiensis]